MNYKDLINTNKYLISPNPIKTTNIPTIYSHNGAVENIYIDLPNMFLFKSILLSIYFFILCFNIVNCLSKLFYIDLQFNRFEAAVKIITS